MIESPTAVQILRQVAERREHLQELPPPAVGKIVATASAVARPRVRQAATRITRPVMPYWQGLGQAGPRRSASATSGGGFAPRTVRTKRSCRPRTRWPDAGATRV